MTARETAKRAGVVTLGTLLSRVLGLVRDMVIAASFSVRVTDAFFVAFTIPNALRGLLAEGAVSGAFIPVHADVRAKEGDAAAKQFYARFLGTLLVVLLLVTAVGMAFAAEITTLYAGGFDRERLELTAALARWVFPYITLMGVAAVMGGALNAALRFAAPAFSPVLLNVALIAFAAVAVPVGLALGTPPIFALAVGALVGGVLQVAAQAPGLARAHLFAWPRVAFGDPHVRRAFRLMVPLLAGLGVYQLNVLLSRRFASGLGEGAQSYLYYAQRLTELPQGLFAFAVATATLPTLSALRAKGDHAAAIRTFADGTRLSLFVAIPSSVFLMAGAEPTVAALFGRGGFTAAHVHETALATLAMAPTIWAVSLVRTSMPLFYAYGDTRTPVLASAANLIVFVGACLVLTGQFAHVGIAAANSLASVAQLAVLALRMRPLVRGHAFPGVLGSAARTTLASLVMGGAMAAVMTMLGRTPPHVAAWVALAAVALAGGAAFVLSALVLRIEEARAVVAAVRRRLRR